MIKSEEFENLISRSESTLLDFKREMYDFENDLDFKKTASFVKDVISFCNTIRTEPAYIIMGIEELPDKSKSFHGLKRFVDEAILQDKVKNKVHPRPHFLFYEYQHFNVRFGIFEFPVTKYATPILPIIKMAGLQPGQVYYRQGTSNTEALALEVINISDWLKSLPDVLYECSPTTEVRQALRAFTDRDKTLSSALTEIYLLAKKYHLEELVRFCGIELQGINDSNREEAEVLNYRIQNVFVAPLQITINPYYKGSSFVLKKELRANEHIQERPLLFSFPIAKLEDLQKGFNGSDKTVAVIQHSFNELDSASDQHEVTVNVYIFPDTVSSLLTNIRQRGIDLLMKL